MPLNDSYGVFPEALPVFTRQHMQKLYFTTSSREHNGSFGHAGENMDDVLNMGRKDGKYMRFRPSRAPLFSREFCTYSAHYDEKPLGDHEANKMLAESFRPYWNKDQQRPKLDDRSTFSDSFVKYSRKQQGTAKPPNQGPDRRHRTRMPGSFSDSMLVTTSFAHDQHKEPKTANGMPPMPDHGSKPMDNVQINPRSLGNFQTRYMTDFPGKVSQGRQRPMAFPVSNPAEPGFPGLATQVPHEVWDSRRCNFLGPGR